jgi:hypothetical protein
VRMAMPPRLRFNVSAVAIVFPNGTPPGCPGRRAGCCGG